MARNFNPRPQVDKLPIASGISVSAVKQYNTFRDLSATDMTTSFIASSSTYGAHQAVANTALTTLQTVLSYSGQGYIDVLAFLPSETNNGQLKLTIDGVVIFDSTITGGTNFVSAIGTYTPGGAGSSAWAGGTVLNTAPGTPVQFNSSILIEHRVTGGASSCYTFYRVVKTA